MLECVPRRGWIASLASLVVLAGCASMSIGSYADRNADLTKYQSYGWAPTERLATGDPRLDNNPFFERELQADVERHLSARGFRKVDAEGDLVVHYHASVTQSIDVAGVDTLSGYCEAGCDPFVYDAGTIVVDLVDRRANRLVWRGWARGSLEGAIDDQDWMDERIDEAVTRIMERLPRNSAF